MPSPALHSVVERVRRRSGTVAKEIVASLPRQQDRAISPDMDIRQVNALVRYMIDAVLTSLTDTGTGQPANIEPVPRLTLRNPQVTVTEISRLATTQTWQALVAAASDPEREQLLLRASHVFTGSQRALAAALEPYLDVPVGGQSTLAARQLVATALVQGEPAEHTAAQANIRLASSYVVAAIDDTAAAEGGGANGHRRLRGHLSVEHRPDVLPVPDDNEHVLLLPALSGIQRSEARVMSKKALQVGVGPKSSLVVAVAPAPRDRVPTAVDEARLVLQIVRSMGYGGGVYQLEDVPIEASLLRSPDLAQVLALRLAPLYGSSAPLMETLEQYLESSQDRRQAAARLHIHSNTLDYRLRRIRELTGLSPSTPRDIQILGAATAAWRLLKRSA